METDQLKADNLNAWAREFSQENRNSIDYFLKHGSAFEKALMSTVVELATEA
ncbi:hypothetical protein [Methanomethylovorans sp.]|uniref:hypothetical protein n=1 Tax=Methanomethylovorans sp. TaxID=2758717 RepID=UPI00351C0966